MGKILVSYMIILLCPLYCQYWERTYDFDGQREFVTDMLITDEGRILILFDTNLQDDDDVMHGTIGLLCVNQCGEILFLKYYRPEEATFTSPGCIIKAYEGNYLIEGVITIGVYDKAYILLVNEMGDTIWTRIYGGVSVMRVTNDACMIGDSGFYVVGGYPWLSRGYVLRINRDGDTLWERHYPYTPNFYQILPISNGDFMLRGENCLTRIDSLANLIWSRYYEIGYLYTSLAKIIEYSADTFLVVGGCCDSTIWVDSSWGYSWTYGLIMLIDGEGDIIWKKALNWNNISFYNCYKVNENRYILAGRIGPEEGNVDVLLICIDGDGDTIWTRTFGDTIMTDLAIIVCPAPDGGIIVGASRYPPPLDSSSVKDIYLIKTDSLGYVSWVREVPIRPKRIELSVFPNPFNSSCVISINVGAIHELPLQNAQIEIFDLRGNVVGTPFTPTCGRGVSPKGGHEDWGGQIVPHWGKMSEGQKGVFIWHPDETIPSGVYLVRVKTQDGQVATKRIVLVR